MQSPWRWSRLFLLNQRQSAVFVTHLLQFGLYKKSCPYTFHMLEGNFDVWKLVTEIREKCSVISNQGTTAPCNTFHSRDGFFFLFFFFLFSGLKETQEKILGRSTRKYAQDLQLGKKKHNKQLHLGSTWRNLFTPIINIFLRPESI